MKIKLPLCLAVASLSLGGTAATAKEEAMRGVPNPAQAHIDYMLKCQGCHQPSGAGNTVNTPPLKNEVARFLHVEGGREFLARVPGVASVDLDDARLTQLLNWTIYRFDRAHMPAQFKPYTQDEVAKLRRTPLRLERQQVRAKLMAQIEKR